MPKCPHGFKGKRCRECFPPDPILTTTTTECTGWTWKEFLTYIRHEQRFSTACERIIPQDDADACFMLHTENPHGFRGMPVRVTTRIGLYKARGKVPDMKVEWST